MIAPAFAVLLLVPYQAHLVCITDDGKPIAPGAKRAPDRDVSCDIAVDKGVDISDNPLYTVQLAAEAKHPFSVRPAPVVHKLRRGSSPQLRYVDDEVFAHGKDFPRCADLVITGSIANEKKEIWRRAVTFPAACPVPKVTASVSCNPKVKPNVHTLASRNDPPTPIPITCRVAVHPNVRGAHAELLAEDADSLLTGKPITAVLIEDDGHDIGARVSVDLDDVAFPNDVAHHCAPKTIRAAIIDDGSIVWTGSTKVHAPGCR